ncbi:hypothetical protein O181_006426 [Austropuccinia psidii MF-1]|uniref:Lysophospholipase n=1 Tax=Austropuccinia psidii MF-1 TaxID=1389203 RepID=A0A9Q3BJ50_9BASI|nr:hypothetical protein [Austropuccinia psidii MF-1]
MPLTTDGVGGDDRLTAIDLQPLLSLDSYRLGAELDENSLLHSFRRPFQVQADLLNTGERLKFSVGVFGHCYPSQILMLYSKLALSEDILKPTSLSYAPSRIRCSAGQNLLRLAGSAIRKNQTLFEGEQSFLQGRKSVLEPLWRNFFIHGPGNKTGYQSSLLMDDNQHDWPILGLAHSGGGERAALYGAGVLHAFDGRTSSSPLRGILQLSTYITGLSGSSWLVTSLAANDYPRITQLVESWELDKNLVFPGGSKPYTDAQFLDGLYNVAQLKRNAGFHISLTDVWGLALAYHFLPGTSDDNFFQAGTEVSHGAGLLFSALKEVSSFKSFKVPLPIVVSNHNTQNTSKSNPSNSPVQGVPIVPLSVPIYEYSPLEFGSFDPCLSAFIPTEFLGTPLDAGKPLSTSNNSSYSSGQSCVRGFDQAPFILGTSASFFNAILPGAVSGLSEKYVKVLKSIAKKISREDVFEKVTTASYPNPFKGINGELEFDGANTDTLEIVDGGENGENLALNPLLVPARQLDVIVASDASADSNSSYPHGANWPTGISMINTFLRVHHVLPQGAALFPKVPTDPRVWEEKGLAMRPTFFGCDAPSQDGNGGYPLIIYLPNSPLAQKTFHTNTSTLKLQYSKDDTQAFLVSTTQATIQPAFEANHTDGDWATCLSCALIERTRNRMNVARSGACQTCFSHHCYMDGSSSSRR